jgi:hypothetical protein
LQYHLSPPEFILEKTNADKVLCIRVRVGFRKIEDGLMRYYKQLHKRNYVYIIALALGAFCLFLAFSETGLDSRITFLICGIFALISGWVMRKGNMHYIEINDEKIIHRGFRNWTILKSEVTRVERGRKGWINDKELYLKIVASKKEFEVDDGFLPDEKHVQELAKAIGSS